MHGTFKTIETQADPFKLESLIAWAEKQQSEKEYDFWCNRCYLGQYFEAHRHQIDFIGTGSVTFKGQKTIGLPSHFNYIAQTKPHTFGAALERARKFVVTS